MKKLVEKNGLVYSIRRVTIVTYGIAVLGFALIGILDKVTFLNNETNKTAIP